ncbi:hypothetical protein E2K98_13480 [Bacillus salipaludis]|uniref:Uncharacterized protein n=1 Tax=Bacillus salipaludis TaxID=2547811 RepID=A0A4R5VQ99_9BACI|nr:hypothetical protein [Bacillus salipaludis]TDK60737.1 hypothetical protein E2K98_13480 [Bacillus salipaludis]
MNDNFFADYKNFIVVPEEVKQAGKEGFEPKSYAAHYIVTLSIYDSRLSALRDASKYEIDVEKSIKAVLKDFNQMQSKRYHLQLLELDKFKNYFILALSTKIKFEPEEENEQVSFIIDKMLMNSFYVGQSWFNLIGEKGKVERKLFCWSFKEYKMENQDNSKIDGKFENISELIPKNGQITLVKASLKQEVL